MTSLGHSYVLTAWQMFVGPVAELHEEVASIKEMVNYH